MKAKLGPTLLVFCMMASFGGVARATLLEGYVAKISSPGIVFTPITIPGSSASVALDGINNAGVLVGCSEAYSSGCTSGIVNVGGVFTTVDYPGASYTALNAINSGGTIVGEYFASGTVHGLLDAGGALTTIDVPGASFTAPHGINDSDEIVGEYIRSGGFEANGYIEAGGSFTTVNVPGAAFTILGGLNNSGQMVGTYAVSGVGLFGFWDSGGKFTTLSIAGASAVSADAINDNGQIVGTFLNDSGVHGFLFQKGAFTAVNYPGAADTWAQGINGAGEIVGYFQTPVPEPSGLWLVFIGLIGLGASACGWTGTPHGDDLVRRTAITIRSLSGRLKDSDPVKVR